MKIIELAIKGLPHIAKIDKRVLAAIGTSTVAAVVAATKGVSDLVEGRTARDEAFERYNEALAHFEVVREDTENDVREYGDFQINAHTEIIGSFADWLERNEANVKRLKFKKVNGVKIAIPDIPKYVADVENITRGLSGIAGAVGAGFAAPAAAVWGVTAFGTAGTGSLISTLSGAAAHNAALAALGGGTIAAGGGGMAAGAAVLSLTATIPVLLVGGFTLGIVGAKAKTASREYVAAVEIELQRLSHTEVLLGAVQTRILELTDVLQELANRAKSSLDLLYSLDFDSDKHAREFLLALQLVTAVKEVLSTPVLDPESGELTEASINILKEFK